MVIRRVKQSAAYRRVLSFYKTYEQFLIPGTLLLGLLIDFLTFQQIAIGTFFRLLGVYIIAAGILIAFMHIYDARWEDKAPTPLRYVRIGAPLFLQFAFGALLSATFLYYWMSGTSFVSWPFILIVAVLLATNDVLREYYMKPVAQISVYFFLLFTIGSVMIPYIAKSIDPKLFALSGVVALGAIALFVAGLARVVPDIYEKRKRIGAGVIAVFLSVSALYVFNVLPPIPLSLQASGVYHDITRANGVYELEAERLSFLARLIPGQTIHIQEGEPVYVYTAIFAPTDLNTVIFHDWQRYNREDDAWMQEDRLSFSISGGREGGYRGYSVKRAVSPGIWRVDVKTETEQVLGRVYFRIEYVDQPVEQRTITR